jgi:hypothetical protein
LKNRFVQRFLKDGSETADEFRQFLREVDSEKLIEFSSYCLENAFQGSGQVLQDLINEVGRRLGFQVENGRYQGVRNDIGFDGIWSADGESLVVEVKTTDAYTIKLDVIARYRDRLVESQRIPRETPILLVIGRNDTESLEAQVRGSRHAWAMRIIGIEALMKLMKVNLTTSSDQVTAKIHKILRPFEYTRIDDIVDIVFTTAEDKESEFESPESDPPATANDAALSDGERRTQDKTPKDIIDVRKASLIARLGAKLGKPIQRRRYSLYSDVADEIHAVVAISKPYKESDTYWFAYHEEPQRRFLLQARLGVMMLGTTDSEDAFAVPAEVLEKHWAELNSTVRENGKEYKHLHLYKARSGATLRLKNGSDLSIEAYRL